MDDKKGFIVIIIILLIATGFSVFYLLTHYNLTDVINTNKGYHLVKVGDYDNKYDAADDVTAFDKYTLVLLKKDGTAEYTLNIYKDKKVIKSVTVNEGEEIRRINNSNYFYIATVGIYGTDKGGRGINFDNLGINEDNYQTYIPLSEDMIIVQKNDQYGVMNIKGEMIVPFGTYDTIASTTTSKDNVAKYAFVEKNKRVGVINSKGKLIIPVGYDISEEISDEDGVSNSYGIENNDNKNHLLYLHKNNEIVVFTENGTKLFNLKNSIQVINNNIYHITSNSIEKYDFDGNLIKTINNGKRNFVSILKNENIIYEEDNVIYQVDLDENEYKLGTLNTYKCGNEGCYDFNDYLYAVKDETVHLYTFKDHKEIGNYTGARYLSFDGEFGKKEYYLVWKSGKGGLIDATTGEEVIPLEYVLLSYKPKEISHNDTYVFKKGDDYYIIDCNGIVKKITTKKDNPQDITQFYDKVYIWNNQLFAYPFSKLEENYVTEVKQLDNNLLIFNMRKEISEDVIKMGIYKDGKPLEYTNEEDITLKYYIGTIDDRLYFLTSKGVYILTNE